VKQKQLPMEQKEKQGPAAGPAAGASPAARTRRHPKLLPL